MNPRSTSSVRTAVVTTLLTSCCLTAAGASAQVPTTMSYQGRLLENTPEQIPASGTVDVVFSIWSGPNTDPGAVQLWTESWTGVALSNGVFQVLLGSNGSPLDPADLQTDSSLFLEFQIDGEALSPRQQLGSAPFAMVDQPANELQDLSLAGDALGLSGSAATVDLSAYVDNADAQTLSLAGDALSISDSGSSVDLALAAVIVSLVARIEELEVAFPRTVFVTSEVYTGGNLGGLAGADARCQALADAAGLPGTFLAWLSDTTGSPVGRFIRGNGAFELVDGTRIADNWDDLIDGTIDHPIDLSELGTFVDRTVWTGTDRTGSKEPGNRHCANWTSDTPEDRAILGTTRESDSNWTFAFHQSCSGSRPLYCFN